MAKKSKKGKHSGLSLLVIRSRHAQAQDVVSKVTIGAQLGQGGSATVYAIDAPIASGRVAKIYKDKHRTDAGLDLYLKLMAITHRHEILTADLPFVLWPDELIFDRADVTSTNARDALIGFTMPALPPATVALNSVLKEVKYRDKLKTDEAPRLAARLADHVARLHQAGFVFCDMNPKNIHVTRELGQIFFLDADGFQVTLNRSVLPSRGITEGYASPAAIHDFTGNPTALRRSDDDAFVLAILLFQLLVDRAHPFATGPQCTVAPNATLNDNIRARRYAYADAALFCPEADALAIYRRLAVPLKEAFYRSFLAARPLTAADWARLLAAQLTSHLVDQPTPDPTPALLQAPPPPPAVVAAPVASQRPRSRPVPKVSAPAEPAISPRRRPSDAASHLVPTRRPRARVEPLVIAGLAMIPLALLGAYQFGWSPAGPTALVTGSIAQAEQRTAVATDPSVTRDVAQILADLPDQLATAQSVVRERRATGKMPR